MGVATSLPGAHAPVRVGPHRVAGPRLELLLGLLSMVGPLSTDLYLPALPTIGVELGAGAAAAERTVAVFFGGLAAGQLVCGPLLDRLGRRPPLLAGLAIYALASVGCALAPTIEALLFFRFLQAVGVSTGLVVPRTIVRDLHTGADAARLLSRLVLIVGVVPILAPLLGGMLLTLVGWRALFAGFAVLGALATALAAVALPETAPSREEGATVRSAVGVLLRDPVFVLHTLGFSFVQAGLFAYIAASPHVFIDLFDVPATRYGWFFGVNGAGLVLVSQLNRLLLKRAPPRRILAVAVSSAALSGFALVALAATGAGGLWAFTAALFVFVASFGAVGPNATTLALHRHGARAGLASAVLGSIQFASAGAVAGLVTLAHDGTALPLALGVATCATLGWLTLAAARRVGAEA